MSRASDITLFLIIVQAAIGFVNATGLFTEQYAATPQNPYSGILVQNLTEYKELTEAPTISDYVTEIAAWAWQAFIIGLWVVLAVITIFPTLVWTFHVPVILSVFIQAGVYYVYAIWYSQYKSGKGWKFYE